MRYDSRLYKPVSAEKAAELDRERVHGPLVYFPFRAAWGITACPDRVAFPRPRGMCDAGTDHG